MLSFRIKILITSAIFLTTLILFALFIIRPMFESIKKSSEELLATERELAAITEKSRQLAIWDKEQASLDPELEKIKNIFVDAEMPVEFAEFLEKTARECNLALKVSLANTNEKEEAGIFFLDLKISTKGAFPDGLKFLDKLENAPYLIDISSLSIIKGGKEQTALDYLTSETEFNFSLKVFASSSK